MTPSICQFKSSDNDYFGVANEWNYILLATLNQFVLADYVLPALGKTVILLKPYIGRANVNFLYINILQY